VLLAFVYFTVFAVRVNIELGVGYTAGPRDAAHKPLSTVTGRLSRAYSNHVETLPWFAATFIVAHLAMPGDGFVVACGWVYLAARVLYLPAYVTNFPFVRSSVWAVATGAILAANLYLLALA
ncbi:MAG: MAPEG family protein, partial [Pseudomonadota bacterium]